MEAFYYFAGFTLVLAAFGVIAHGIPSLIVIEKHYHYEGPPPVDGEDEDGEED